MNVYFTVEDMDDVPLSDMGLITWNSPSMISSITPLDSSKVGIFASTGGYDRVYPTVSFEGAFSIGYYFLPSNVPDGNVVMYYWSLADYQKAATLTPSNATGKLVTQKDAATGEYVGQYSDIAAKAFDETVFVAAVYNHNGTPCITGVTRYSLGQYCKSQAAGDGSTKALAAATAVYGSYAKAYFILILNKNV